MGREEDYVSMNVAIAYRKALRKLMHNHPDSMTMQDWNFAYRLLNEAHMREAVQMVGAF